MFKLPRQRIVLTILSLCVCATFASVTSANHSWNGYHWARTSNPFTLKVGRNLSSSWTTPFNTAIADWTKSSVMNLTAVTGTAGSSCAMVRGTVQVCNGLYGANGWLGLASINLASGTKHITQGRAQMNDTYFNTSTYNNPNERLHVMCQEVGHTFGLDHQSESGRSLNTCMDYFSNTGANATSTLSTHPNQHDYDELVSIYSHLDGTTTIGSSLRTSSAEDLFTNPSAGVDLSDPNNWGYLKSQSVNGRSSTYERFENDGSSTITHVFWTLDAAKNCPGCDHRYDH